MIVSLLPVPLPHNVITFCKDLLLWTDPRGGLGSPPSGSASFEKKKQKFPILRGMMSDPPPALTMPDREAGEPIHQWVFRGLRRAIMSGRFPPGQAVTIRGLAERMGVSAMPVREALRRLVAERALALLDNRRVRVPVMTAERFDELLAARTALETEAAIRALPLIDAERLAELHRINAAIDAAVAAADGETVVAQNLLFHLTLYGARPDSVLVPLIESVWLQTGPFMRAALDDLPAQDADDHHLAALAAIASGDAGALRRAIRADIQTGLGHLARSGRLASEPAAPVKQQHGGEESVRVAEKVPVQPRS